MGRLAAYGSLTCAAAAYVVFSAFRQRSNFFAAAVYLSKSNASMMILWNFGVFLTILFGRALQTIFFGSLRLIEIERLHERAWYAVTESLLALTIFRESFDTTFVILFVSLLFLKVFHWLASDRVEMMEQAPTIPRVFHFRMVIVLSTLWFFDIFLIALAADSILSEGPSVMIMFASEYMIMLATLVGTTLKYGANAYDLRSDVPWENKSVFVFYVELACDFLKLATYLCFFSLILTFYGLPLNILRDVYITARSFVLKIRDLSRYRQATRNMDQRYPNATPDEMERLSDKTCIICREDMEAVTDSQQEARAQEVRQGPNDTPKKLPCGHIFHFHCLRSWLERQQSCPTCRRPVLSTTAVNTRNLAMQAPPAEPNQAGANVNNPNNGAAPPQPGAVPTPTRPATSTQHLAVPTTALPRPSSSAGQSRSRPKPGKENPLVAFQLRSASKPPVTAVQASRQSQDIKQMPSQVATAADSSQTPSAAGVAQTSSTSTPAARQSGSLPTSQSDLEAKLAQRKQQLEAALRRQGASSVLRPSTPQTSALPSPAPALPSPSQALPLQPSTPTIKVEDASVKTNAPSPESKLNAKGEANQSRPWERPIAPLPRYPGGQFNYVAPPAGLAQPAHSSLTSPPLRTAMSLPQQGYTAASAPRLIPLFDPLDPSKPNALARFFPSTLRSTLFPEGRPVPPKVAGTEARQEPALLREIPEGLSDDQLASLAEVTREGLQTRLRLLNSTQETLRACVDQIQEAMKAIDGGDVQAVMQVVAELNQARSAEGEVAHTDSKGKGKAPDEAFQDGQCASAA